MKTKRQLWQELLDGHQALAPYAPSVDGNPPRSLYLERELAIRPARFARYVGYTADSLGAQAGSQWLSALLTGAQGEVFEAYAYGTFVDAGFRFTPKVSIASEALFRNGAGTTELDGRFTMVDVYFDIKSLARPSGVVESLLDEVNYRIRPTGLIASVNGPLDFSNLALDQTQFGNAVQAIVGAAAANKSYAYPGLGVRFRFVDAATPVQFAEHEFNAYRFAEENRFSVMTSAKQVPRAQRFLFVYVYSEIDHLLGGFPDMAEIGERALARRVFMELTHSSTPVRTYCIKADPAATVGDVSRAIGGLLFVNISRTEDPVSLRFYLNPNANPPQRITKYHVDQITDFDHMMYAEDFAFDNY